MDKRNGDINISSDANVWPHEQKTALALARAGYTVQFVKKREDSYSTSTDVLIDGCLENEAADFR